MLQSISQMPERINVQSYPIFFFVFVTDRDRERERRCLLLSCCSHFFGQSASVLLHDFYVDWGNGCFWHVQHEMVKAEKAILGRGDDQLTSYAGYAGAKTNPSDGKLCYHNMRGVSDYGKAGAGEVCDTHETFLNMYHLLLDC